MGTNLKMQGVLEPGILMDMLQVMNRRKTLTGHIEVSAAGAVGKIWIREGSIIAANWKERQGELAVESILRLKDGLFVVNDDSDLPPQTINKDTVALLMLCMRAIGKEALTPTAPARAPAAPRAPAAAVAEKMENQVDEPMPAPARLPSNRPRMRGLAMAGRWSLRIAAALLLLFLAGMGVIKGHSLWLTDKGVSAGDELVPPSAIVPTPAPTPVAAPAKLVIEKPALPAVDGWPEVMLSALAASGQRHWCAILNGQLLGVGEQVDGVTVRAIRANGVVLEYQGKRKFLCAVQK